jgi:hypothetical protein
MHILITKEVDLTLKNHLNTLEVIYKMFSGGVTISSSIASLCVAMSFIDDYLQLYQLM